MNKSILLLALAAVALPVAAPAAPQHNMAAKAKMVTVKVNGLVCDFCVQALTKTFKKEAAVDGFHVDLTKKEIHMTFKAGMSLDDARIKKHVTDAGYNVVGILR